MDLELDIKEEPVWPEGAADPPLESDLQLPLTGDKLAEIKVEPGVKEEHKIKDMKIETQDEACNTLVDPVQEVETADVLTGGTLHSCRSCRKTFKQKSHLTRHMLIHEGRRPYQCTVCRRTFNQRSILDNHLLTHSEEKLFLCSICGKAFRRSSNLRLHEVVHSESKRFLCAICGITFRRAWPLRRHITRHKNSGRFSCLTCGHHFKTVSNLKRHQSSHTESEHLVRIDSNHQLI